VTGTAPFLTVVLTGRNDDHGVDFRSRFFRTLAFNHRELSTRGIAHEFVFVEWAPDSRNALLVDLVGDAVPALDRSCFHGYVVDARYQEALSLNPRLQYLEYLAKNVGIRRASGRFVLSSNCDVLLGRRVLDVLEQGALEARVVYRAARHDLKMSVDGSRLDWDMLEDSRNLERRPPVLKPPLMGGGTGDFLLLDRDSFHELGGFNEVYRVTRVGLDQNFVVKALSSGLAIRDIGGPVYHMNHPGSYQLTRHAYAGRESEAPYGDIRWHSRGVIYVNRPTWGLADVPARPLSSHVSVLDFSWDAIPPLVDLRRVVLPVASMGLPHSARYREW
jgi:hypothetical protein